MKIAVAEANSEAGRCLYPVSQPIPQFFDVGGVFGTVSNC
jgi:hypothetical protein